MKFAVFEQMSREEALAFLQQFLTLESEAITDTLKECSGAGIVTNFSIESIAPFMRWIAHKLKTIPQSPDLRLPSWIRDTESYAKNLFDFDELSKILILRVAYYLGESFVRNRTTLRWTVGNAETAVGNMPVVSGFASGLEMAPILVAENLLARVTAEPTKLPDIDTAVEHWNRFAT